MACVRPSTASILAPAAVAVFANAGHPLGPRLAPEVGEGAQEGSSARVTTTPVETVCRVEKAYVVNRSAVMLTWLATTSKGVSERLRLDDLDVVAGQRVVLRVVEGEGRVVVLGSDFQDAVDLELSQRVAGGLLRRSATAGSEDQGGDDGRTGADVRIL